MDIPINAKVYCQNQVCGFAQGVILDPKNDVVTHVVVKESKNSQAERLVPLELIDASLADNIHLKINTNTLQTLPPLFDVEYIQTTVPHYMEISDMTYLEPVAVPEKKIIEEKIYHIPRNELPVNHGTRVYSADGYAIGTVDEFFVDQNGGHVSYLILREGHIFGQKDVFIPITEIEKIMESDIHLKLNKEDIEQLPAIPIRRFLQ
ncbi:MAG: PRC-barrel domain-containing protein [Anaerolineales bacterium]|jgi:sporulation protein YlmC with PRC-barrel domain